MSFRKAINNTLQKASQYRQLSTTTTKMSGNTAAWLNEAKTSPFEVKEAPMWKPEGAEILIKNKAVAVNPIDGAIQKFAPFPTTYPAILGFDVAGEVAEAGPEARFKKGDKVVGMAVGIGKDNKNSENAFQKFSIVKSHMAAPIPDGMPFENAAVIPLGLSTAACGLFQEEPHLALQYPTEPRQKPTGKTILVWGGSSSVGANGIQMAVAAGYEVIATASKKNHDFVQKLGASQVFDYSSPSIEEDLIAAFKGKELAGVLDCIGGQACQTSLNVIQKTAGKGRIATTKGGAEEVEGITIKRLFGTTLAYNGVGKAVYEDYLGKALAAGTFTPAPAPFVVGKGLESIQEAVDKVMGGMSAQKAVVTLD